jgi:hypothetical protein
VQNLIDGSVNDLFTENNDLLGYISTQACLIERMLKTNELEEAKFKMELDENGQPSPQARMPQPQWTLSSAIVDQLVQVLKDFANPGKDQIFEILKTDSHSAFAQKIKNLLDSSKILVEINTAQDDPVNSKYFKKEDPTPNPIDSSPENLRSLHITERSPFKEPSNEFPEHSSKKESSPPGTVFDHKSYNANISGSIIDILSMGLKSGESSLKFDRRYTNKETKICEQKPLPDKNFGVCGTCKINSDDLQKT